MKEYGLWDTDVDFEDIHFITEHRVEKFCGGPGRMNQTGR